MRSSLNTPPAFRKSLLREGLTIVPDLDEIGDYDLSSHLSLVTPLAESLSLKTTLKTEYDSSPGSEDVDKWDNTLMSSLSYEF